MKKFIFLIGFLLFTFNVSAQITMKETHPIYPSCETINHDNGRFQCMVKAIKQHVRTNFDYENAKSLGVNKGHYKFDVVFYVSKEGKVVDIQPNAEDKRLDSDFIKAMGNLPIFQPATINKKPVKYKYQLPIQIKVQ